MHGNAVACLSDNEQIALFQIRQESHLARTVSLKLPGEWPVPGIRTGERIEGADILCCEPDNGPVSERDYIAHHATSSLLMSLI